MTAYQLGTAPVKEEIPDEIQIESELPQEESKTEDEPIADADTNKVTASVDADEEDVDNSATEASVVPESVDIQEEISADEEDTAEEVQDVSAAAVSLPTLDFSEDTLMQWPVSGNILLDYSMDQTTYYATLDQYRLSPAIAVQAVEGAGNSGSSR